MKQSIGCWFQNEPVLNGTLEILAPDLQLTLACREEADVCVTVEETDAQLVSVELRGNWAQIRYGGGICRFNRALAILARQLHAGVSDFSVTERPLFLRNGAMIDMSRNAVMNVKTVKFMMRKMALMGMNTYMLYTEDTYEVGNRPYFGHMRGRYTREELKELDSYALRLGIELVPCIQLLGHLSTHLHWAASAPYRDTASTLLVNAEETELLMRDILASVSACFTSRRLHMGMDETHDLGLGRSLDIHGYRERKDLYFEHLKIASSLAMEYGFRPMMWSDMFFRLAGKDIPQFADYDVRVEMTEDIGALLPEGVQPVFWDYYHPNEEFYQVNLDKHIRYLSEDTVFAGGVWLWSGHCPHYSRSLRNTVPALEACRKTGLQEVLATVWLNGSESSLILSLAGLAWYADYDYRGCYDADSVRACFEGSCGVSYDDLLLCELPEHPDRENSSASRALLYNDPLAGLIDRHIQGLDTAAYYRQATQSLRSAVEDKGFFFPAMDVILKLSSLLENKADFGIRLKAAYAAGDRAALAELAEECLLIRQKVTELKDSHRAAWFAYNKTFGWEVHDIRYGGLLNRFDTARYLILAYLAGETDALEELAQDRMRFDCLPEGETEHFGEAFFWSGYTSIATANVL